MILFLMLWKTEENKSSFQSQLSFEEIELKTLKENPFKMSAGRAEMRLDKNWEMSLYDLAPFSSGDFSVQPEELLFIPKNGTVILKHFDVPNLIEIQEVVIDPATSNVSFHHLQADYFFAEKDRLHWDNWKMEKLKSRDLLQHWSRLMSFFQDQKHREGHQKVVQNIEKELNRKGDDSKSLNYHVDIGELSLHQSILHFRIGLKGIRIETPQGVLESSTGRLKLSPLVLTTAAATLNQNKNFKRALFDLKTGELRLE